MRITGLGHASVLIETAHGSVLTDPWLNPAYFGSWFPFPDNSELDWDALGRADYLFVSQSLTSPTDGPIGDSSLWVHDGTATVLNQNDARPSDLSRFRELGPVDAYLIQFSGAIWFPMVYELPKRAKQALGQTKRERQFDRTLRYIEELGARYVFSTAGPPCFLDEELWGFNDIFGDESNIFPDQTVYLDWLAKNGHNEGRLLLPGSVAAVSEPGCPVAHPVDPDKIFGDKTAYLRDYQARRMPEVEAARKTWAHPEIDVLASITEWFTPLLEEADHMAAGINGGVRFTAEDAERGDIDFVLDFVAREVRPYAGEMVELGGWLVQRRCAHLKADLTRFGQVEDGVLTCQMHGWKWRLADGKCLTSVGHDVRSEPAERPAESS